MNRRDVLKSSLLGAGALAVKPSLAQRSAPGPQANAHIWPHVPEELNGGKMPNILWICPDMQRFDTIEGLNNDFIHTPNLRKLMAESVTLDQHIGVRIPGGQPRIRSKWFSGVRRNSPQFLTS